MTKCRRCRWAVSTARQPPRADVVAVAPNPTPPLPEGADLSMLAAIRGAFTLAAQS